MSEYLTISEKKFFGFVLLFVFLFFENDIGAQISIPVYTDTTDADTLKEAVIILKEQLNKCAAVKFQFFNESSYKNYGVLVSTSFAKRSPYNKILGKSGAEGVFIKSDARSITIVGNTKLAVQNGIFIYLERLGFRYYFPNPDWYIVPSIKNIYTDFNYVGRPSFDHRRIWYGYGTVGSKYGDDNYKFWCMANRLGGSMNAVVGHAYDDIVARNQDVFKQHPEWFYPVSANGSIPSNPKFDLTNKSLIQFIISDALKRIDQAMKRGQPLKMITMSPSDGLGTCNTPACQRLGTVTDRVYSLINTVARAVSQKYPGTWVSGMSYSEYAEPPTIKLEPNVFVSIATAFNNSRFTTEELIREWSKKAGKVGVYDYLGLYAWDFDLPGKGRACKINEMASAIKSYYRLGARGYEAESTPGSINKGLGHYIASKLLWDVNADVDDIKNEFFQKCFGRAADLMKNLWEQWEIYPYTMVRESNVAAWIDIVNNAESTESSPAVRKRLMHIKTYFHYLFLYNKLQNTGTETDRITLLNYAYNTFDWASFSSYPILWVMGNGTSIPGLKFNDPKAKYKFSNPAFADGNYINQLIAADRKVMTRKDDLKLVGLNTKFKKIKQPDLFNDKKYASLKGTTMFTGPHYFIFQVNASGRNNYIELAGDFVTGGGGAKPIVLTIKKYQGSLVNDNPELIRYNYRGKKDTERVHFDKLSPGSYLLKVDDPNKLFRIRFSDSLSYAVVQTAETPFSGYSRYMSFYVPSGINKFRVFKEIEAIIISPTERMIDMSKKGNEEIDVSVEAGETGLWMINFVSGKLHIEGVPPFFCMDPSQLLIPMNK